MAASPEAPRAGRSRRAPPPSVAAERPSFVVQEHHARRLHWDFRLEREGVLVSWALPKGVPTDPGENHLAVQTDDHALAYGSFHGRIPAGEYGAGEVTIWDKGTYEVANWGRTEIKVALHGERLQGGYVLFPTGGKNWLIHRMKDQPAVAEPMPTRIRPMLALAGDLPAGQGWAFEFKWDGVRGIAYLTDGRLRLVSRTDNDLTRFFPELRGLAEQLASHSAVLDGEIVALDEAHRPSFARLQRRLHLQSAAEIAAKAAELPTVFFAFDLLHLDGRSLLGLTYDERREALEALDLTGPCCATPPAFPDSHGTDVLRAARDAGLEGVVAKRRSSPYRPGGRHGEWVKTKNVHTQAAVIGGWTEGTGSRQGSLGAVLLGLPEAGALTYIGKVGTGFTEPQRRELLRELRPLERKASPFAAPPPRAGRTPVHFTRPRLVGEVQYGEWTRGGLLRHPSWRGLRTDQRLEDVVRE